MKQRLYCLDFLKGIAIIAVVLYHFGGGILPYGYLGVDVFLVVGGYFLFRQLTTQFENSGFSYWKFILRKLVRLWPLVVLIVIVSMVLGYFLMLPNDYENLAESAAASSVFANNILQCITTKNYWDIINLYKPLMHLWYVGVLMQAYVVLPLIAILFIKICKNVKKGLLITAICLTILSMLLFFLPIFSTAWKFYYLPFRLFEITSGGILALWTINLKEKSKNIGLIISLIIILFLLCSRWELVSSSLMLIITVIATLIFIECSKKLQLNGVAKRIVIVGATIGKGSYSIYIWHQMIIAFLFYSVFPEQSIGSFLLFLCLTIIVSLLSYKFIELPLGEIQNIRKERVVIISTLFCAVIVSVISLLIYTHAGVVRDVPELEISKNDAHRGMHSEYCDRVYSWDRPFKKADSTKILVIGNSFGRDWANILYEYNSDLDISFLYYSKDALLKNLDRVNEADYVFYALGLAYGEVPDTIVENVDKEKLYIISNKNYGESNGIIYSHRNDEDYYGQTVEYPKLLEEDVIHNEQIWGNHFINMMTPVVDNNNRIRVFTDDNKFISQDCRHLTKAGAQYYSRILDIDGIFEND